MLDRLIHHNDGCFLESVESNHADCAGMETGWICAAAEMYMNFQTVCTTTMSYRSGMTSTKAAQGRLI